MTVPLANAIFDGKLSIDDFMSKNFSYKKKMKCLISLISKKVDKKIFPIIIIKNRLNEYPLLQ